MMWLFLVTMANAGYGQESATARGNSQLSCQQIAVVGVVRNPARLNAKPRRRILEVLALVGGPNARAEKTVLIIHNCSCSPCDKAESKAGDADEYNLSDVLRGREHGNPYVVPGDIVMVPEADPVFVMGNVITQRSIRFSEGMTVTRAIAMTGGVMRSTGLVVIRIHRTAIAGPGRDAIIVSLKAIKERRIEDVSLKPLDVVEVSDELGHFKKPRLSTPAWDSPLPKWNPPLNPHSEPSGSGLGSTYLIDLA
jgi:protein involved in polysaccharide export with SLBB domain